ncbi:radical SAM protein [Candidatus Woesearchaeota archaeon]|nr:MAG: radical SAM protein [Candidatus Woesearchaeota archaeon]
MASFTYKDLAFARDGELLRCRLFARYSFTIPWNEVSRLGPCTVKHDELVFPGVSEKKVHNKMGRLVEDGLCNRLVHELYKKPAVYITSESGIPLIGTNEYGIVDRGSNIIEVKPVTGCNFNCIYCSVDEGKNNKTADYLVEEEYLASVAAEVAKTKQHPVEFNIGPQGEPLLYPRLVALVRDLRALPQTGVISINTNGSLLSTKLIDELAAAGLTRINLSIPALDPELAAKLAGVKVFPLAHLLRMLDYGKDKLSFLLAPVLVPGHNEQEMASIVKLSRTITSEFPTIGIQNYLSYPKGRKPVKKPLSWERFFSFIKELERTTGTNLTATKEDFRIHEEKELPKPFKKGQVVEAVIVMPGRYAREMVAAAHNRAITVQMLNDRRAIGKRLRVRIVRDKHNIFKGVPC